MSPNSLLLIYPMFAMFLLSLIILLMLVWTRVRAVRQGKLKAGYFKTFEAAASIPEEVVKASRHFSNLFETPILFYVICILGMMLSVESPLFNNLAWCYVAARIIHAYIHLGRNKIPPRMLIYGLSWTFMTVMWAIILMKVAQG